VPAPEPTIKYEEMVSRTEAKRMRERCGYYNIYVYISWVQNVDDIGEQKHLDRYIEASVYIACRYIQDR